MSIQLLLTILFIVAIAMFVVDFARGKSLVYLRIALLTGALLLISV